MKPHVVIYCCANSTVVPEEHVENVAPEQEATVKIVRLPCSGRTDVLYILKAVEEGADVAMIVGCPEGQCRFLEGNLRAGMRVKYANKLLAEAGLGGDRVKMFNVDPTQGEQFEAALKEMLARAKELGPWLAEKK